MTDDSAFDSTAPADAAQPLAHTLGDAAATHLAAAHRFEEQAAVEDDLARKASLLHSAADEYARADCFRTASTMASGVSAVREAADRLFVMPPHPRPAAQPTKPKPQKAAATAKSGAARPAKRKSAGKPAAPKRDARSAKKKRR